MIMSWGFFLIKKAAGWLAPWASPLSGRAWLPLAALALYIFGYWTGYRSSGTAAELANLKLQVGVYQKDQKAIQEAANRFEKEAATNAQLAEVNARLIEEFRNAPKSNACKLTPDDVRRLRRIR